MLCRVANTRYSKSLQIIVMAPNDPLGPPFHILIQYFRYFHLPACLKNVHLVFFARNSPFCWQHPPLSFFHLHAHPALISVTPRPHRPALTAATWDSASLPITRLPDHPPRRPLRTLTTNNNKRASSRSTNSRLCKSTPRAST